MSNKLLLAVLAVLALQTFPANAVIINLTATGKVNTALGVSTIWDGSQNVVVADGTPLSVTFRIDTDGFPPGVVVNGGTIYNVDGGSGCLSTNLPQDPLLPSMISSTLVVGGVTLNAQSTGTSRNCDYAALNDTTDVGDALAVRQDAYNSVLTYYTDDSYTTVSPAETPFHITEIRINTVTISGFLTGDPFSPLELATELAQMFTLNDFYGTSVVASFSRGRYICNVTAANCYNEPVSDGNLYAISGTINNLFGAVAIIGSPGPDSLFGTAWDDRIDGKGEADVMTGLAGNDTYIVDHIADTVVEMAGEGTDTVRSSVTYTLPPNVENLILSGSLAINGTGNSLNNTLTGNSANNLLNGKTGADTMKGGAGNDTYYIDNSGDRVVEAVAQGIDTIRSTVSRALPANVENLTLTGAAAINGTGNTLANKLTGNGANNTLNGGLGNDTLTGGAGQDRFLFNTTPNASANADRITDFDPADDAFRLENAVFTALPTTGTLAAAALQIGTAATTAAHRILYDPATGNLRYDADGTGPVASVRFAVLSTMPALTNADFVVQ
jgi:Ca2+-binding RTX toxin-like protein